MKTQPYKVQFCHYAVFASNASILLKQVANPVGHFIVVNLVGWPLNDSAARVDFVLVEPSLLFLC